MTYVQTPIFSKYQKEIQIAINKRSERLLLSKINNVPIGIHKRLKEEFSSSLLLGVMVKFY
ncbi:hypothetical protein B6U96_00325 [Archaeoglobales archaeon ex4484_92]|nr:MAG: hypothetical protein B6U96_00325 [Archaeoglobales archaeon ex4484_92]